MNMESAFVFASVSAASMIAQPKLRERLWRVEIAVIRRKVRPLTLLSS